MLMGFRRTRGVDVNRGSEGLKGMNLIDQTIASVGAPGRENNSEEDPHVAVVFL
jgi:hypothetical protein